MAIMNGKKIGIISTFALIVAILAVGPILLSNNAAAAAYNYVKASGTARVTCSDGSTFNSASFSLSAQKTTKQERESTTTKMTGGWDTTDYGGSGNSASGSIYAGKIDKSGFNLNGLMEFDSFCPSDPQPVQVIINGACNSGGQITIAAGSEIIVASVSTVCY